MLLKPLVKLRINKNHTCYCWFDTTSVNLSLSGDHGWCWSKDSKWGFCQANCHGHQLKKSVYSDVLLEIDNLKLLPTRICKHYAGAELKFNPELDLCAANQEFVNHDYITFEVKIIGRSKIYMPIFQESQEKGKLESIYYGGQDSCSGDSGQTFRLFMLCI